MKCTSAPSRRRNLEGGDARAPALAETGNHASRNHAGGGFPGRASAGATTASINSLPPGFTANPTTFAALWTAPTLWAWGSSSTWSTIISAPTAIISSNSPRITSPTAMPTIGARPSTSTGPGAGPVREFFLTNAAYWIEEYHVDGLRLDATQQIFDAGGAPLPCRADAPDEFLAAHSPQRCTQIACPPPTGLSAELRKNVRLPGIEDLLGRVESQAVEMELLDPAGRIGQKKFPHRACSRARRS